MGWVTFLHFITSPPWNAFFISLLKSSTQGLSFGKAKAILSIKKFSVPEFFRKVIEKYFFYDESYLKHSHTFHILWCYTAPSLAYPNQTSNQSTWNRNGWLSILYQVPLTHVYNAWSCSIFFHPNNHLVFHQNQLLIVGAFLPNMQCIGTFHTQIPKQ